MRKSTMIVLALIVLGVIGAVVFRFMASRAEKEGFESASDASRLKGTINVAGDNYLGYWFLTSPEFKRRLRQEGYAQKWTSDGGNYPERHEKFARGEYDIMVLPVNSYILHGRTINYPGVIIDALSDSKGADNIVAYRDVVSSNPVVNDLGRPDLKICVTPDSPSSFLLGVAIVHFDLKTLKADQSKIVEANGSEDAYERLLRKECSAAVLWEPDVSRALDNPDIVSVFGSHQIAGLIIDVFVIQRTLVDDEKAFAFFKAYFETLQYYSANRDEMIEEIRKNSAFKSRERVEQALQRIAWFNIENNCRDWFSIPVAGIAEQQRREKIIETIVQVTDVMLEIGELERDPLRGNPYQITIRTTDQSALTRVCAAMQDTTISDIGAALPVARIFTPLNDQEWSGLKVIGKMKIVPILFQSGTTQITDEAQRTIDRELIAALEFNYPQYRILVKGHTTPSNDESANQALAQARADSVREYLVLNGLDQNRIKAAGVGSREPLPRPSNEGEQSYRSRLPRVEFILLEDK